MAAVADFLSDADARNYGAVKHVAKGYRVHVRMDGTTYLRRAS